MSTALLTRPTTEVLIPRVNLLPQEIAEAAKFRRVQAQLGVAVLASVGVVGLLFVVASGQVTSAQDALDEASAQTAAVQSEVNALADVPKLYAEVSAAEGQLSQAMGEEVRWSNYLTDLSLTVPNDVALVSLSIVQAPTSSAQPAAGAQAAAGTQAAPGTQSVLGNPGIASVTFEGEALEQNDVAAFLDAIAKQKGVVDPYFTNASKEGEASEGQQVVAFSATATIDESAKSGRYTKAG